MSIFSGGVGNLGDGMFGVFDNSGSPAGAGRYAAVDQTALREQQRLSNQTQFARNTTQPFEREQNDRERANRLQQAQISANASIVPAQLQQDRFRTVFPFLSNNFNSSQERVGGANQPLPNITVGGVYSPQQTQEQVNAARSQNDRNVAQNQRQSQDQLAGRGFGSNSPLLQAIQAQQQMAGMQANSDQERQLRFDAATANARQQLDSETLRQNQWTQNEDADIRRRQVATSQANALLSALAGLV
jgi:hypothetical protein